LIADPVFSLPFLTAVTSATALRAFNFWSSPVSPRRAPSNTVATRRRRFLVSCLSLSAATACTFPELFTLPFYPLPGAARRARQRQQPLQRSRRGRPTPPSRPLLTHPTTPPLHHHRSRPLAPEQNAEWPRGIGRATVYQRYAPHRPLPAILASLLLFPRLRTIGAPIPCARLTPDACGAYYLVQPRPPSPAAAVF
jgi:hypothetical protein